MQRRRRIGVGALLFEGNTFSPVRTTLAEFENKYLCRGNEIIDRLADSRLEVAGALSVVTSTADEIVPLIATHGGAGGRVTSEAYAALKTRLLDALRKAGPLDGLYLALHGAMICEGIDDAEADLLTAVRDLIGTTPLVVSCDLHAHVTESMLDRVEALIGYQHYPHDDTFETGMRAAGLLLRIVSGEVRPAMAMRKIAALFPPISCGTMTSGPMRDLYHHCRALEATGEAIAVSYFPVQPWLDLPSVGAAAVALVDGDGQKAERLADDIVQRFWRDRDRFATTTVSVTDALRAGQAVAGEPVVIVDCADTAGGGAAGDSVTVLRAFLEADIDASLAVHVVDPEIAHKSHSLGAGASIDGDLGHKIDPRVATAMPFSGNVVRLFDGGFRYRGGIMGDVTASLGPSAVLRIGRASVLVSTHSCYEHDDEHFAAAGIDVRRQKFIVVKNHMNFRNAYAWAPAIFIVDGPGPTSRDLRALPWARISRPCYPLDETETPNDLSRYSKPGGQSNIASHQSI